MLARRRRRGRRARPLEPARPGDRRPATGRRCANPARGSGWSSTGDEGPVDEAWAYVRLRFDARDIVLGPAHRPGQRARAERRRLPATPQHAGDRVVFDAGADRRGRGGRARHLPGVVTVLEEGPRRGVPVRRRLARATRPGAAFVDDAATTRAGCIDLALHARIRARGRRRAAPGDLRLPGGPRRPRAPQAHARLARADRGLGAAVHVATARRGGGRRGRQWPRSARTTEAYALY